MTQLRWRAIGDKWTRRAGQTNGPFPVYPKPVIGGATTAPTGTTFPQMESAVGPMLAHRTYNAGWTADFTNTAAAADITPGRWSIYSFKLPPGEVAAGTHDASINSFLGTIPAGHKTTLVLWHEPEDDIINGSYTLNEWRNAQVKLGSLVHGVSRPELTTGICLMAYSFSTASGRNPDNYWISAFDTAVDYIGIDAYQPYDFLGGTQWEDWSVSQARFTPWCEAKNKPIILMEYACAEHPSSVDRKVGWLRDVYVWAGQNNCTSLCYFNLENGVGMNASHLITSSTESQAEYSWQNTDSKL